jgi:predicted kinase
MEIKPQIIFIGGYLNSGKGTYCGRNLKQYIRIGVSDIIRQIIGQSTRKELQATSHLDKQVAQRICDIILTTPSQKYVIDGIRQVSIYNTIRQVLSDNMIMWECVWLEVPIEECKRRFLAKSDSKENISFEEAFQRDKDLGLLDLEKSWKRNQCTIIKNY